MKEEPYHTHQVQVPQHHTGDNGLVLDSDNTHIKMDMEGSLIIPAREEGATRQKSSVFPTVVGVTNNPLLELEITDEPLPDPGQSSRFAEGEAEDDANLNPPNSVIFLNENEDYDEVDKLGEITAVINADSEGVLLEVQDVKPVAIPIPMTRPNLEGSETEIIISHRKKRGSAGQMAKPIPCICTICHTGFPNQQLFQLHMSNVHADERPFHCSHCGKGFVTALEVTRHESIHDPNRFKGEPKFQCDLCDKKYHLQGTLKSHRMIIHLGYKQPYRPPHKPITQHHAVGVRNKQQPKKDAQVFKCPYCDLKYGMRCLLKKHLLCHTGERHYECKECGNKFTTSSTLKNHIRNRHLNPSSKPRPSVPSFMYRQPCPCTVCGKVFKVPSQLQNHILLHTGEKPHECGECGQRFRIKNGLRIHQLRMHETPKGQVNEYEAYKCRICGKDGMMWFTAFQNHRLKTHRHLPFDSEREKPYGCGICGKPYYLKGQTVCALLKHDPASLLAVMFKYKCPACPEERFGYHSTLALRRHWEKEHPGKPLPVRYRAPSGMYTEEDNREDILPTVRVNKELAKRIQANGPIVKSEFPLYTEFGLLPVEHKFYRDLKKSKHAPHKKRPWTCHICETTLRNPSNMKRHLKLHDPDRKAASRFNCSLCGKRFLKLNRLRLHERQHTKSITDVDPPPTKGRGRPLRKRFEVEASNCSGSVNINDVVAVRTILGNRVVSVIVTRFSATEIHFTESSINNENTANLECKRSKNNFKSPLKQYPSKGQNVKGSEEGNNIRLSLCKVLSIVLERVDD